MKKKDFDKLVASVKQAGKIERGKLKPSRVFRFKPADIKAIREKLGISQYEFALMIGVSPCVDTPKLGARPSITRWTSTRSVESRG